MRGRGSCRGALMSHLFFFAIAVPVTAHGASQEGRVAYLALTQGYWQVWVMAPDGSNPSQITRSASDKTRCSWFPDGRHLLVNALDGRLYRVDAESGEEIRLPMPLEGILDAVVSPDGSRIAFSLSTTGSADGNDIWIVKIDGTDLRKLTAMPRLQHAPAWDADGAAIYFLSGAGGQDQDIWRTSMDSRSQAQLTAGALYHFDLAVAPDGKLAFSSNRTGNYEIFTQGDGEPPVQWTRDPALDGGPAWGPGGRDLIFHSMRSGSLNLWRMREGEEPYLLTNHPAGARAAAWWHPRDRTS